MLPPPPRSTLFPYTTLFRSDLVLARGVAAEAGAQLHEQARREDVRVVEPEQGAVVPLSVSEDAEVAAGERNAVARGALLVAKRRAVLVGEPVVDLPDEAVPEV